MRPTLLGLLASLLVSSTIALPKLPTNQDLGLHVIRPKRSIDLTLAHSLHKDDQLEKTIEPTGYKLELEPYIEDGVFKGRVKINVTWLDESDEISLHSSHDLEISECEVKVNTVQSARKNLLELQKLSIKSSEMDLKKPIYKIKLSKAVSKGTTGHIDLNFTGNLETQSTEAFFKSCYDTSTGQTSTVVATQLRPNNARRLFPCFDEPGYKTPFELSVVRPKNMVALSNMPVRFTEEITGEPLSVWDHFEKTPPMSTFTLGLVIADLKVLDNKTLTIVDNNGKKIDIRVWGRQEFLPALTGVTNKAERVFKEITEFWNMSLPLTKLDLVALPNYQGVKPADNWGLIVFKESELSGRGYYQLSMELMYQWVGALVTPEWWSEIHLNKALVGYLAAATSLKIDDGSEMEGNWPMTVLYSLYYEFSKRYPHSRITGMKQETACIKIELVFRMFNYTLGESTFRKGLRMFLKEKEYKTFTGQDVWKYLNVAALEDGKIDKDISIAEVADTWMSNDRLPMVTVERNYNTKTALASQKVYLRERPHDVPGQEKMLWWIPLVTVDQTELDFSRTAPRAWIRKYRDVNLLGMPDSDKFVIVNPEEIGPFPVNYDTINWNLLADYLQSESRAKIPVLTRAKILHDAWNLAYAGDLSFATALNMTLFLKNEKNHMVWDPVFTMIDHIGRHIDSSEVHKKFEAYVRTILTPLYEELGSHKEDEESWKTNLRGLCKTFLCKAGYKPCIKEAQAVYKTWMDAENPDEGNPISNQYICPVFKWGSQSEWDFGLQRVIHFPPTRKASERTYLLKTLAGCPVHTEKIIKLLNITVLEGNGNFTDNDIYLIFSMLTGGSRGYNALFHFLDVNWDAIRHRFENKTNLWDNLITSATSVFTTQEGLDMVTKLYRDHRNKFGSAEHIVEKSLKNIREETKWSDENLPVIEQWLDQYLDKFQLEDNMFVGYDS